MASFIFTVLYFIFITLCMTVFTLVFCFVVYLQHKHKILDHIPGPKRDGFFRGNIQTIERLKKLHGFTNGFEVFKFLSQEYGPVIIIWIFHIPFVYVSGAELVKKSADNIQSPQRCLVLRSARLLVQREIYGKRSRFGD